MTLTQTELNIRASWAINCALASFSESASAGLLWQDKRAEIEFRAKEFLELLGKVKQGIQPEEAVEF